MPVKYGIIEEWQTRIQVKTRRRPSKAELERKEAIQRMLISLGIALLLIFAAFKLGAAGITLYNLIRLLVGSLAYLAIFWYPALSLLLQVDPKTGRAPIWLFRHICRFALDFLRPIWFGNMVWTSRS